MVIKNFILNLVGRITWFLEQRGEEGEQNAILGPTATDFLYFFLRGEKLGANCFFEAGETRH